MPMRDSRLAGWRGYVLALALTSLGVLGTQLLAGEMFMTPLVGTVVLVSVFLGIGPAHVAIGAAWLGLLLYEEPSWQFTIDDGTIARRWAVSLIVALVLVWIAWSLQRLRRKEAERAAQAEQASAAATDLRSSRAPSPPPQRRRKWRRRSCRTCPTSWARPEARSGSSKTARSSSSTRARR